MQQQHRYAELEFTEDPFKDVGFEDPFVSSTDDPFAMTTPTSNGIKKKNLDNLDPFAAEKDPFAPVNATINFDSPFGSGSGSCWSAALDPFAETETTKSSSIWGDDFSFPPANNNYKTYPSVGLNSSKNRSSSSSSSSSSASSRTIQKSTELLPKLSEEDQMAWAAAESVQLEQERKRKAELQENADLEMAIALSKSEIQNQVVPQDRLI